MDYVFEVEIEGYEKDAQPKVAEIILRKIQSISQLDVTVTFAFKPARPDGKAYVRVKVPANIDSKNLASKLKSFLALTEVIIIQKE